MIFAEKIITTFGMYKYYEGDNSVKILEKKIVNPLNKAYLS